MARSPMLETPRLVVGPFEERHLVPRYVAWLNDAAVVRFSEQRHLHHTLESCRAYRAGFEGTPNHFWALEAQDPRLGYIGTMTAYVDPRHRVADMGILLGERRAWGQGLGSEAWAAAANYLFRHEGMRKVTAGTLSTNQAMLGIMRKTGMVEDGRRVRHALFEGREVDVVHAALFGPVPQARLAGLVPQPRSESR